MSRDSLSPFCLGLMVGLAIAFLAFLWGQWVGSRDHQLMSAADRHAAVSLCREQNAVAILIAGADAKADRWQCASGSSRLVKVRPALASPLAQGDQ